MVALASEAKRGSQSGLGQQFVVFSNELGEDLVAVLKRDNMGKADDPDLGMVSALLDPPDPVDMEKLRVDRSLVQAELQLLYTLSGFSAFHINLVIRCLASTMLDLRAIIRTDRVSSMNFFALGTISDRKGLWFLSSVVSE